MAGFDNDVMFANNVDFTGNATVAAQVTTDGQLLIGSTAAPNIKVGIPTSTDGSITITAGPGTLNFATTGGQSSTNFNVDANTAPGTDPVVPTITGEITVTGGQTAPGTIANVIRTDSLAANTYTIEIQQTSTAAAKNTTLNGVSHFNSGQFTNDEGFISLSFGGIFTWQTIVASQTLAVNNGYFCISPGGALSLALPAVSAIGDTIAVVLDGATSWTITQPNAGTQIRIAANQTTLGVGGTLASTAQGDTIYLVCQTANARWAVSSFIGNITFV